jgi:hypothetical protein
MAFNRLSMYRTTIRAIPEGSAINYAGTDIVKIYQDHVVLNSGGWRTVTTKRKMNQAARQFALGYSICQKRGVWGLVRFKRINGELCRELFSYSDEMKVMKGEE